MTDMTIKAVRTTMLRVPWPDTPWLKGHAFGEARNLLVLEVESALITHPAVLEAAVVPEADPEGLLKPKAFVVLRADAKQDGLHDALKEHVKQKIGPWKYPRWIDVVESLPKTATGKIQRFKLRDGAP